MSVSPGWTTDLEILRLTGSEITHAEDHVVVRTPHNPGYRWGNCILVLDAESINNPTLWISRFTELFPDKGWNSIGLPEMPSDRRSWEEKGFYLEKLDVLTTTRLPKQTTMPERYTVRQFSDDDWTQLTQLEIKGFGHDSNHDKNEIEDFVRQTNRVRQQLCQNGNAAWFGALLGDQLISHLGVVKCGETARYQSVETDVEHRRKGLASHLLGKAAEWSRRQGCDNWVIVTEETNDAGRVYRRAGFEPDVPIVNASRNLV